MNYCRPNVHYKPWLSTLDKEGIKMKYGGGNQQECDAVTKPWTWGPGEGLYDNVLKELNDEQCFDNMPGCETRVGSCPDESMRYWCSKTCKYC